MNGRVLHKFAVGGLNFLRALFTLLTFFYISVFFFYLFVDNDGREEVLQTPAPLSESVFCQRESERAMNERCVPSKKKDSMEKRGLEMTEKTKIK